MAMCKVFGLNNALLILVILLTSSTRTRDRRTFAKADDNIIYDEFPDESNLVGIGDGACVKNRNCSYTVGLLYDPDAKDAQFEVHLYGSDADKLEVYVAVGISSDQHPNLGNDELIGFFYSPQGNGSKFTFFAKLSEKGTHFVVTNFHENPKGLSITPVPAPNHGLYIFWKIPSDLWPTSDMFPLLNGIKSSKEYYVFAAQGKVTYKPGSLLLEKPLVHAFTKDQIPIEQESVSCKRMVSLFGKIHVFCMTWTWMFFVPVGILIARYYKETCVTVRLFHRRLWFILHVVFMFLGLTFCLAGYIAVLVKNSFSFFSNDKKYPGLLIHQLIGFFATFLLLILSVSHWVHFYNPLVQTLVVGTHTLGGLICYVLGFFNIVSWNVFAGKALQTNSFVIQTLGTISGVILIGFFALLSAFYAWIDSHLGIYVWRAFSDFPMPITSDMEAPRPNVRKIILSVFTVLAAGMCTINTVFIIIMF